MAPTLIVGDTFLNVEVTPTRPLQRGDVVAFRDPRKSGARDATIYVSRLIGLPGERIKLRDGIVHIDDVAVKRESTGKSAHLDDSGNALLQFTEQLASGRTYRIFRPTTLSKISPYLELQENMPEITVPAKHYFMLSDNRLNAMDSRFASTGNGPGMPAETDIVGWAKIIYVSKDPSRIGRRP